MKRYVKYKDSGIPWIGEVPEGWKICPFFAIFTPISITGKSVEELLSVYLDVGVVRFSEKREKRANATSADMSKYQYVDIGDFVLNNQQAWRGSVGISQYKGIVSPAYLVMKTSKQINSSFANYLVRSPACVYAYFLSSRGVGSIQRNIYWDELKRYKMVFPPLDEQREIVEYLDSVVAKINGYIAEKEAEIEKLGLLKQSVIAHAVTKGINPNAKMKDSGIPWIGEVPEHWLQLRGKNIFTRMARVVEADDEVITCFRDGQVTLRKNRRTDGFTESFKEIGYQGIRPGDLVIHQMDAFAGAIGVSDSKGKGTPVYICLQPKGEQSNFYYAYLLREMARTGYIKSLYRGIRERSSDFRYETFGKLLLPIPPADEQRAIVEFIDRKVKEIDGFISAVREQIEKLKLYKQRLISDVVTGKIKVCKDTLAEEVI